MNSAIELSNTMSSSSSLNLPGDGCIPSGETSGSEAAAAVRLSSIGFVVPMAALFLLDLFVIFGNSMVVVAVLTQRKLRTVTNTFVVSLAMSDLFLGLVVLPFSSVNEVLGYWPFGSLWCSAWLAVDVWLCTASILNLCAISLDRFLAIRCPIRYPSLMPPLRAKFSIAVVWILSLAICIPPLLGWKDKKPELGMTQSSTNHSQLPPDNSMSSHVLTDDTSLVPVTLSEGLKMSLQADCRLRSAELPACALTSEPGYIVYSACGSFWVPMLIMVSFYVRIYRTAVRATHSLRSGFISRRATSGLASSSSDSSVNLRVHRGGALQLLHHATASDSTHCSSTMSSPSIDAFDRPHRFRPQKQHPPTVQNNSQDASRTSSRDPLDSNAKIPPSIECLLRTACSPVYEELPRCRSNMTASASNLAVGGGGALGAGAGRKGLVQIRTQLRRFNREKKAAKTVGIIVGCFVFCWSPFFTVYFLGAFCTECTPAWVFTIFFWLGYCNSAVNPIIYGLCSKDFRSAFKRLLRCSRHQRSRTQLARLISGLHHHNSHAATHLDFMTVVYR